MNDLYLWQIRSIIRGYLKSKREGWIQIRFLAFALANVMGCKVEEPESLIKFAWEEETISQKDLEDLKAMVEEAKRKNALLNQNNSITP